MSVVHADELKPRDRKVSSSSSASDPDENINNDTDGSDDGEAGSSSKANKINLDYIQQFFASKLGLHQDHLDAGGSRSSVLQTVDFDGIIGHWKEKGFKKIITMVGAGISTCKCSFRS